MSKCLKRNLNLLRILHKSKPRVVKSVIKEAPADLLRALCKCALNVLKGNVKLTSRQLSKLKRYKNGLRVLANKKTSNKKRRDVLQKGGFLSALLTPVLGILGGLLGSR